MPWPADDARPDAPVALRPGAADRRAAATGEEGRRRTEGPGAGPRRQRGLSRRWLASGASLLVALAAAACSSPGPTPTPTTSVTSDAPALPIVVSALPMSTDLRPANVEDPYTERVVGLLLRGLVRYDAKGKAVNEVAESIETPDNRVFTVRLGADWVFGNGEPVTASSFVDAWNYAARASSGQFSARDFAPILGYDAVRRPAGAPGAANDLAGLEVLDARTLRITLTQTEPGFADALGQTAFAPLPKAALTDPAVWSRQPVGNGPYRLDGAWPERPAGGATIRLRPNPTYRGGQPPQNAGIDLRVYDTAEAAYGDLRTGVLDVVDQVPVAALPRYRTELGSRGVNQPVGVAQSLVFPLARDPWQGERGLRLRQAISTAIDRHALASGLLADTALPATDLSAPVVEGYSTEVCAQWCTRDQDLAARSAQLAGSWSGPLTIAYAADRDDGPVATDVCREVTQSLGLPCQPRGYPTLLALREAIALGSETGPYLETWTMARPTLAAFLVPRFETGSPDNGSGFTNDLVDSRFGAAATASVAAQPAAYAAVEPLVIASLPVVPLWSRNAVGGTGPHVTGVRTDVFGSPVYPEITRP